MGLWTWRTWQTVYVGLVGWVGGGAGGGVTVLAQAVPEAVEVAAEQTYAAKETVLLMGSRFDFGAYAKTQDAAEEAVARGIAEVERIEALISSWQPDSQTSAINDADEPVAVDRELLELIRRAQRVSELTDGAFDLTAGGLVGLYRFGGQDTVLPSQLELDMSVAFVDYRDIEVDVAASTVWLRRPGLRIGFGGIGKGYAANRALAAMRAVDGVTGAVANASGDMATWGTNARGEGFEIGIADPRAPGKVIGTLRLTDAAVVTSGDYERYFTAGGVRYAHIVDPRTGLPTTGLTSATVVCPDAELADALATSLFVLGVADGLALINSLANVEALLIDAEGRLHRSAGLNLRTGLDVDPGQ